jgi:hypothetical protein
MKLIPTFALMGAVSLLLGGANANRSKNQTL